MNIEKLVLRIGCRHCSITYSSSWKSLICAAKRVGNSVASKREMVSTPLTPSSSLHEFVMHCSAHNPFPMCMQLLGVKHNCICTLAIGLLLVGKEPLTCYRRHQRHCQRQRRSPCLSRQCAAWHPLLWQLPGHGLCLHRVICFKPLILPNPNPNCIVHAACLSTLQKWQRPHPNACNEHSISDKPQPTLRLCCTRPARMYANSGL